jgi:hypothetical protein
MGGQRRDDHGAAGGTWISGLGIGRSGIRKDFNPEYKKEMPFAGISFCLLMGRGVTLLRFRIPRLLSCLFR